ncbi:unnamed protein product [Durusdinium trenchii]|uniref:Uncharacterized protein n=1 Tax=Durusdinium trenchii TaxID=1381693 RepID=A0ABP0KR09_9DINO
MNSTGWPGTDSRRVGGKVQMNSFTTRLLYTLMPATWYARKDASIRGLLQALAADLTALFEEGLTVTVAGQRKQFFVAFLGCKGDWPWLRKAYNLASCFTSRRVCHLCSGSEWWNMTSSCEARDWRNAEPAPHPYKAGTPSPLRSIPGGDRPSAIKPDLMHTFNIGIGGDFAFSAVITLCCLSFFDDYGSTIQKRLDCAYDRFAQWCFDNHKNAQIKSFELNKFHMTSLKQYPRGTGRAHDTGLVCKWLNAELQGIVPGDFEHPNIMEILQWTLQNFNMFYHLVHGEGLWMPVSVAQRVVQHGFAGGEGFAALASLAKQRGWHLYKLRPKLHIWVHISTMLEKDCTWTSKVLNPLCWGCWSDEDYIGKCCRVARRLNAGSLIVHRVMTRCLMKYKRYFEEGFKP